MVFLKNFCDTTNIRNFLNHKMFSNHEKSVMTSYYQGILLPSINRCLFISIVFITIYLIRQIKKFVYRKKINNKRSDESLKYLF